MRFSFLLLFLAVFCLSALPCQAESTFAFVNSREVITKCDAGAKAIGEIRGIFAERQQKLAAMQQEIVAMQKAAQNKPLEKNPKGAEMDSKVKKYGQEEAAFRNDVGAEESTRLKPVAEKVQAVLNAYGKEKGLTGIQEVNLFLYYDLSLNITEEIIKRVNQAQ